MRIQRTVEPVFLTIMRERKILRGKILCEQNKERNKVNTEMDDHTKVNIFANELKKYMKVMNELEEQNFGSRLKRIISKCDLNALLSGEMISNGELEENQSIPGIHTGNRKPIARSQKSEYRKKLRASKSTKKWISWDNKVCSYKFMLYI